MGNKTLDDVMASAYEKAGIDEADVLTDKGFIPTGNLALDFILGGRGFPRGRSIELYGLSQSGKTTTAAMAAAQAQKLGLRVLYLDFEQALDEPYLNALGVDTRNRSLFYPFPAASLEQGAEVATAAARTGQVGLIIFDSVAAMTPRSSLEKDEEASRTLAMDRARLLGGLLSKLNPILAHTGTCALFINHLRDVIETGPVRPGMPKRTTTPGGTALKYYSSVRVQFTVVKKWKASRLDPLTAEQVDEAHSVSSRASVTKNKVAPPHQNADLYLELGAGFSNSYSAMQVLVGHKVVRKSGAFYYFPEALYHPNMTQGQKGSSLQGLQSILDLARVFPEWESLLVKYAIDTLPREKTTVALPVIEDEVAEDSVVAEIPEDGLESPIIAEPVLEVLPSPPALPPAGQTIKFVGNSLPARG